MTHQDNIRKKIIDMAYGCGKGCHVGSSLSVADILSVLVSEVLTDADKFILSKGHAAMAWYATLSEYGYVSNEELAYFQQNDSEFSVLAVKNDRLKITCSTGSLGQGISVAIGIATARKKRHRDGMVYVVVGNGEANEGIVWEAAMFANHNKLDNLCVIIDHNGMQSDGRSENILRLDNMNQLWRANGFDTIDVDGHNVESMREAFCKPAVKGRPRAVVCQTVKGYGISFMENDPKWHHNRLTKDGYDQAVEELNKRCNYVE